MIRIILPTHLRRLANVDREVEIHIDGTPTLGLVLDELEECYPMLRGTIRDQVTKVRRPFLRFFVNKEDWSHEAPNLPLPELITTGVEPLWIVGAMAGG